ncbi:hypothetical protein QJQ45_008445 [Haematococcus lacustris]|nr:hypothetical protein QJQ45_008445 [Haematococcus lacustris]
MSLLLAALCVLCTWTAITAQPSNAAVVAVAGPGQSVDKVLVVKNGVTQVNSTTSSGDGKTSSGGKINIEHDSYGNPWAWDTAKNQSCAVRNDSATLLTDFQAATRCKSSPTAYNSKPDTYGNLWGFENGSSCAYKAANGAAIFYQGYVQSGAYSSPSSAGMASSSTASASSAVVTSWETAPACRQAVTDFNYQPDSAGPSTPSPAKRTKAEQAAGTSQPTKGKGEGKGKAAKAKPAPQPGM